MFKVRTITYKGDIYLKAEDVAEYVRELAGSEKTDTRKRLKEAADNLAKPKEF